MKKLFVGNLPPSARESEVNELFSQYGKVRSIKLITDIFSGACRGFGFIEMEGHEARAAVVALNGRQYNGNNIKVNFESEKLKRGRR